MSSGHHERTPEERMMAEALAAGQPAAEPPPGFIPQIRVTKGPFKGRVYVRNAAGQLVRVDRERSRRRRG